ncbi:helicase associated domain-containing protein [Streptomyces sp. NPDC001880]
MPTQTVRQNLTPDEIGNQHAPPDPPHAPSKAPLPRTHPPSQRRPAAVPGRRNLAAARQFHAREGHLRVPRKHIEHLEAETDLSGRQNGADGVVEVKLGTWLDNVRKRAAKLTEHRRADLDQLGMRW